MSKLSVPAHASLLSWYQVLTDPPLNHPTPPLPFTISTHNSHGKVTDRVTLQDIIERIAKGFPGLIGRDLGSIIREVQARCSTNPVDRVAGLFYLFRHHPEVSLYRSPIPIYSPDEDEQHAWCRLVQATAAVWTGKCSSCLKGGGGASCATATDKVSIPIGGALVP